jgi:hypothetical protein
MSSYLRKTAPWVPSTWITKVVGLNAWVTEEGVIAYIRSVRVREEDKDELVDYCYHQLCLFRRQRSNPIVLEAWGGKVRPVEEAIQTLGPFSKKPFPKILRTVTLHPIQIGQMLGTIPQQTPRKRQFVNRERKPVVKSRIVRVKLGGDSRLPRQMEGWAVEAIHLVGYERKATEGILDCGKVKMPSCHKGYVEPLTYGDLELEYLYHVRARHIYLDVKDPNVKGEALFLVRFRKEPDDGKASA